MIVIYLMLVHTIQMREGLKLMLMYLGGSSEY